MWLFSDKGTIHSNRVLRVLPEEFENSKTIRVEVEGDDNPYFARVTRADAEKLSGVNEATAKIAEEALNEAITSDTPALKAIQENQELVVDDRHAASQIEAARAMRNRYTTLDQLETAVKAFRDAEKRDGIKIDVIRLLPMRHRSRVSSVLGPCAAFISSTATDLAHIDSGDDCEQAMISRVEHDGKMKLIGTAWHPKKLGGEFWSSTPEGFYGPTPAGP